MDTDKPAPDEDLLTRVARRLEALRPNLARLEEALSPQDEPDSQFDPERD